MAISQELSFLIIVTVLHGLFLCVRDLLFSSSVTNENFVIIYSVL